MHELAIAQDIVRIIEKTAREHGMTKVRSARLKVGQMAAFHKDQLEFCLTHFEKDSLVDGMHFDIEEIPVVLKCRTCNHTYPDARFGEMAFAHDMAHAPALYLPAACPACQGTDIAIESGREMQLVAIDGD